MKVCVTGATGFVGAHVARALAQRGGEVLFHVAGYVASGPMEHVWQLNAAARISRFRRRPPPACGAWC